MGEGEGFHIGELTAEVANLKEDVASLWKSIEKLNAVISKLEKVLSRSRGFIAGMMFVSSLLGGAIVFAATKGAKFFGVH